MNQQGVNPVSTDKAEIQIRLAITPYLSPSETLRAFAFFTNEPPWMGCVFTMFLRVFLIRYWYAVTTEQNVYFVRWGFGKPVPTSVLKVPRKDVQLNGNDLTFTVPNETKHRKLYSCVEFIRWGGKFKEDLLQNPSNVEVDQNGNFVEEGAGVLQPVSRPDQTPKKTCPKCVEKIQLDALVCHYCGHQFSETEVAEARKDFQVQIEREKADVDIREQQRKALIRISDLHNNVAKAKSKANAWVLPLLFGGVIGTFACTIVAVALVFIVPMVGGPSEPTAIPGCSGIVVFVITWIGAAYLFRRNAKRQSGIMVLREEETLKAAVNEIAKLYPDWINEIGGTELLLDLQKLKTLVLNAK